MFLTLTKHQPDTLVEDMLAIHQFRMMIHGETKMKTQEELNLMTLEEIQAYAIDLNLSLEARISYRISGKFHEYHVEFYKHYLVSKGYSDDLKWFKTEKDKTKWNDTFNICSGIEQVELSAVVQLGKHRLVEIILEKYQENNKQQKMLEEHQKLLTLKTKLGI